jgi:hypothetical protein
VDKEGEKIKKIEGHGRWKRVKYDNALSVAAWFVFAGPLYLFIASSRER